MKIKRSQQGFTLVELLVAAVIMVLILGALGGLFASSNRAYRANEDAADRQQSTDAAVQLLKYEIGLAGYRGSTASSVKNASFGTDSTLAITKGSTAAATDTITVRYYDDRYSGSSSIPTKTAVSFKAAKDSNNLFNLYRAQDTDNKPAVLNVKNLKVVRYIRKDGGESTNVTADILAALKLELTFTDQDPTTADFTRQVIIGINNPQQSPALPAL